MALRVSNVQYICVALELDVPIVALSANIQLKGTGMQYRRMGASGLALSALGFGAWVTFGQKVGRNLARELIAAAWDHGITFFDNAEGYANGGAEQMMGDVIADLRLPRDGFCVSSKVFFGAAQAPRPTQCGLSRKHVFDACHAALKRLRVDYLDLYYCHRPDPAVPIGETVLAMDTLVRQGKVLYWGTSEWPAAAIREAAQFARQHHLYGPSVEQPQYNLLHRERVELEYAPLYAELGLGVTTWSPLGSGVLSGKYTAGIPDDSRLAQPDMAWLQQRIVEDANGERRLQRAQKFTAMAAEFGASPAPLAIAWCLTNPHVTSVLLGATKVAQLLENLRSLEWLTQLQESDWRLLEDACA